MNEHVQLLDISKKESEKKLETMEINKYFCPALKINT